jgi:hypothetical protein
MERLRLNILVHEGQYADGIGGGIIRRSVGPRHSVCHWHIAYYALASSAHRPERIRRRRKVEEQEV